MIRTFQTSALAFILVLLPFASFAGTPVDIKIEGMTCGTCVESVKKQLSALQEIEPGSVEVSLTGHHANVMLKNDDAKTRKAVSTAIEKAGFTVAKMEIAKPTPTKGTVKSH